jgi:hypothetical protein
MREKQAEASVAAEEERMAKQAYLLVRCQGLIVIPT